MNSYFTRPPKAVSLLKTAGLLPTDPIYINNLESKKDFKIMQEAAISYKSNILPEKSNALAKQYLLAWVNTYQPNLNPIDEARFAYLLDTYGMIKHTMSTSEQAKVNAYLRKWAEQYISDIQKNKVKSGIWINNWNSYRVRFITMTAFLLEDKKLIKQANVLYLQQINDNIDKNGISVDFKQRDSIHYVVFNLHALLDSALIAKKNGYDWYNLTAPSQGSLAKAIQWLVPYAQGKIKHIEFKNTSVPFDRERAKNGLKDYQTLPFDPKKSAEVLWKAAEFDKKYEKIAKTLTPKKYNDISFCWSSN